MLTHAHRRKGAPVLGAVRRGQVGPFGPYGTPDLDDHDAAPPPSGDLTGGQGQRGSVPAPGAAPSTPGEDPLPDSPHVSGC
ncbi:hypothetical protein GCM10010156_72760 [Planobispora rosea]|uniref:Uncharacterized protein n=1 Tax=Planobispora rosea TaxID=35762 RepID=A0A8J3S6N1_PLARO|nr:hypothetical protein GCM10010156_72760 [Planobispora rosea]GIH88912.1 hypothetical protein Pro02_73200 [Planobispora rosea]